MVKHVCLTAEHTVHDIAMANNRCQASKQEPEDRGNVVPCFPWGIRPGVFLGSVMAQASAVVHNTPVPGCTADGLGRVLAGHSLA